MVDSIDVNVCFSCFQVHGEKCAGCKGRIMDRYLVKVSGKAWHTGCLKCCICGLELGKEATCYTKEDKIYCKTDYARFVYLRVHWLWYLCKSLCLVFEFHLLRASYSREQHVYRSLPRDNHEKKNGKKQINNRGDLIWSSDGLSLGYFIIRVYRSGV